MGSGEDWGLLGSVPASLHPTGNTGSGPRSICLLWMWLWWVILLETSTDNHSAPAQDDSWRFIFSCGPPCEKFSELTEFMQLSVCEKRQTSDRGMQAGQFPFDFYSSLGEVEERGNNIFNETLIHWDFASCLLLLSRSVFTHKIQARSIQRHLSQVSNKTNIHFSILMFYLCLYLTLILLVFSR